MRGILMIEPLYHQVIKGNKNQTRRSSGLEQVNGAPEVKKKGKVVKPAIETHPDFWELVRYNDHHAKFFKKFTALTEVYCKPRYKVGEVLYLKEPYLIEQLTKKYKQYILKYADGKDYHPTDKWRNKLFMPSEAAKAFVRITGIRCERLLDISDEDCISEGIDVYKLAHLIDGMQALTFKDYQCKVNQAHIMTAKDSFLSLYKFANKVKTVPNLWVWRYEIEYLPNYKPE